MSATAADTPAARADRSWATSILLVFVFIAGCASGACIERHRLVQLRAETLTIDGTAVPSITPCPRGCRSAADEACGRFVEVLRGSVR